MLVESWIKTAFLENCKQELSKLSVPCALIVKSVIKNKKGSIVYISSSSGIDNNTGRNAYSASKAAIISQAHTLSRELGRYNIRVNSIAPGLTDTRMMNENTPTKILDEKVSTLSLNRIASPEEIANVALFLSSDLSTYVTGQVIRVDGGMWWVIKITKKKKF